MKSIKYSKTFFKSYRIRIKPHPELVKDFLLTKDIFLSDNFSETLRRHYLRGIYKGVESIDMNYDFRILFIETKRYYLFVDIGSHKQLYG